MRVAPLRGFVARHRDFATLAAAVEVSEDLPHPSEPGVRQEMTVRSGLSYKTTYSFSVLAVDAAGNEGALSDSPAGRTSAK